MIKDAKYEEALKLYKEKNLKRADLCRELGIDYHAFTYFLKTRHPELIAPQNSRKNSDYAKDARKETAKRYAKALKLAQTTDLTYSEIAKQTNVSVTGFRTFIQKHHRDLMLQRAGMAASKRQAKTVRVRKRSTGQSIFGHKKYKEAIEACDDLKYIEMTVSEIAREFGLTPSCLLAQLRYHYPEIIPRREKIREEKGLATNRARGPRQSTIRQYAPAIEMLRNTEMTIEQVAELCNVSYTGLRNHLLEHHRDVVEKRRYKVLQFDSNALRKA
ncbi:MAG: hypothetical protein J1E16_11765 [Muribaculaceae bacterium]|nr:hypothetical protein [Muribaculaceae bacterium]